MRRYFICLALPLLAAIGLLGGLIAASAGMAVKGNYWETEGLRRKLSLAGKPGPKIVIVAGSNAYFGINAGAFARASGCNAVNLAMQGALPFSFYAGLLAPVLTPGDTVILPLEYAYYDDPHPSIGDRVASLEASVALSLTPAYLFTRPLADSALMLRHLSIDRIWEGVAERFKFPSQRVYRVGVIDEWGDNIADYLTPESHLHLQNALAEERVRGLTTFNGQSRSVASIRQFVRRAGEQRVKVFASLPNTLDALPFAGPKLAALREDIRGFWSSLEVPLLVAGVDIDAARMLDTPYHPTLAGAKGRTVALLGEFGPLSRAPCRIVAGSAG